MAFPRNDVLNALCHFDVQPSSKSWLTTDDRCYMSMNLLDDFSSFNSYASTLAKTAAPSFFFCHYPQALNHQSIRSRPQTRFYFIFYLFIFLKTTSLLITDIFRNLVINSSLICFKCTYRAGKCDFFFFILNQRVKRLLPKAHGCGAPWGWPGPGRKSIVPL